MLNPGVIKINEVKSAVEEFSTELFGNYKDKYVNSNDAVDITSIEVIAVNTLQHLVKCCG